MSESFFAPSTEKYLNSLSEDLDVEEGLSEEVSVEEEEEPKTDEQPKAETTDADPISYT